MVGATVVVDSRLVAFATVVVFVDNFLRVVVGMKVVGSKRIVVYAMVIAS